jgi:phosphohistidine phosphatase
MTQWMLVRHAKSDWNDSSLSDNQRPLNPRGRKAAVLLGEKMLSQGILPDRILCSTALRTVQTLQGLMQSFSHYSERAVPEVLYFDELYLATPEVIERIVTEHHGKRNSIMCIGHNPGIENLASLLANETLEMKTAHLIAFQRPSGWGKASQMEKDWELLENLRGEDV